MKKLRLIFLMLIASVSMAQAQVASSLIPQKHDLSFSLGREFWFAEQSNYWGVNLGGKYIHIYISSTKNTTAYVEALGVLDSFKIKAGATVTYVVSDSAEMESSGVVERKGIHIWSIDADLTVYSISHQAYTSDGSYVIPTIGWSTDYVVGAYGSLFEGGGNYVYDLPSTMVIVAAQDNTSFTITPSCNLRQCTSGSVDGNSNATIIVFPQGQPQTFQLNRGQTMQFMPVEAEDPDNYDLTGTIVHSDLPVGVCGRSVCPNVPADFPYCDHVEHMMPPVRTWGKTYYAMNGLQPPGEPNKNFARYLFISSVAGQTIYRSSACGTIAQSECMIPNQYGIYWDELSGGQKFTSNQPFLVVEYLNSATYPDGVNGLGDPAEAIVSPKEEYVRTVEFQTPQSVGNIVAYSNYANIVVNVNDAGKTLLDGKHISGYSSKCIDSNWEVFTTPAIAIGPHIITGDDSGVGVWIYGYGFDESYAWSSVNFEGTFESPDTVPPVAVISGNCTNGHVAISDTGVLASKLAAIRIDSLVNITYTLDSTWVEGVARDSSFFNYAIIDSSAPAYLLVTAYDFAGNSIAITIGYQSNAIAITSSTLAFGVVPIGHTADTLYDTLSNNGSGSIVIDAFSLTNSTSGFTIDSATTGPLDSGAIRVIKVSFTTGLKTFAADTLVISGACFAEDVALSGSGIDFEWSVDNADWNNVPFQNVAIAQPITVHNYTTTQTIHVTSAVDDSAEFAVDASTFPLAVPTSGTAQFSVSFTPLYPGQDITSLLRVQSVEAGEQDATLTASVQDTNASSVSESPMIATTATFFSQNGEDILATVPQNWPQPIHIEIENLLGETVFQTTLTISASTSVDPGPLPRGVYFYRLTSGSMSQSGKVILGE